MRPTPDDEEGPVALPGDEVEDEDEELREGRMYPMRLVAGDDDVVTDTSLDRGGWSAEELAMHLEEEPWP